MSFYGYSALRVLKSLAVAKNDWTTAMAYSSAKKWDDRDRVSYHLKSAVSGLESGSISGDSTLSFIGEDLLMALRPLSVVGRMQLRRVPARVTMMTQTTGTRAYWVKRGSAVPVTVGGFTRSRLNLLKVAALTVASDEMLSDEGLGEEELLKDLLNACAQALDLAFLDVANTGVTGQVPASITSTATPIPSSGTAIEDLDADLQQAISQLVAAGSDLTKAVWVMRPELAATMSLARGSSGAPAYPQMGVLSGTLAGLPVLTSASNSTDTDSDGTSSIALIDASLVNYAEGEPNLRTSKEAMIEMSDAPTGNTIAPTAASVNRVSMFQEDATALLATMPVNWAPRRAGVAQVITGVQLVPA